jgi:hypothetical protein
MKYVCIIIILLFTLTSAQIKKQLRYEGESNIQFDCFNLLYFRDNDNKQYSVISIKTFSDSSKHAKLNSFFKYDLNLIKVDAAKTLYFDLRYYENIDTNLINWNDLDAILKERPTMELYYSPSLIGHYYIKCGK